MTQSAYEKEKIIPESFGVTEMGRDLLAQDYLLKQITASLIYPEEELGKKFWDKVYAEAQAKYGTSEIPINTFNKVWIVPEKAVVYENGTTAYVTGTKLKVMLEEDYLALSNNKANDEMGTSRIEEDKVKELNSISSKVVREIVIPELEKEVNNGKNFAQLRQIYNSLILANWYKKRLKDSILAKVYMDKNKTVGVDVDDKTVSKKIFDQYVQAFKTGVYNYIKEDFDPVTQETIPRKYFSGGVQLWVTAKATESHSMEELPNEARIPSNRRFLVHSQFERAVHEQEINNPIQEILMRLGQQFGITKDDKGEYKFKEHIQEHGPITIPGGEIRLDKNIDGTEVLVFVGRDFEGLDHAGRDRNAVYASNEVKVKHEKRELTLIRQFVSGQVIDNSIGLGTGIRYWANGKNGEGQQVLNSQIETDRQTILDRQNLLRRKNQEWHNEGLIAEGRADKVDDETIQEAQEIIENFDWIIAGDEDDDYGFDETQEAAQHPYGNPLDENESQLEPGDLAWIEDEKEKEVSLIGVLMEVLTIKSFEERKKIQDFLENLQDERIEDDILKFGAVALILNEKISKHSSFKSYAKSFFDFIDTLENSEDMSRMEFMLGVQSNSDLKIEYEPALTPLGTFEYLITSGEKLVLVLKATLAVLQKTTLRYPFPRKGFLALRELVRNASEIEPVFEFLENIQSSHKDGHLIERSGLYIGRDFIKEKEDALRWIEQLDRLIALTTDYNRQRIFEAFATADILHRVLQQGGKPQDHYDFYLELIEENPRLALQILEGLFGAIEKQKIDIQLPLGERETIRAFIKTTHGFNVTLYDIFKKEGPSGLARVRALSAKVLADDLSPQDLITNAQEFTTQGYDGPSMNIAATQMVVPSSGASFVKHSEVANLFQKYLDAGDHRGDVPAELRGVRLTGGSLKRVEWVLKEGETYDADQRIKDVLNLLAYPNQNKPKTAAQKEAEKDHKTFIETLKAYLKQPKKEDRPKVLESFYAWVRHNDLLKEKVDRIQGDHTGLQLLRQLFSDRDNLPFLFNEILTQIPAELLLTTEGEQIRDLQQVLTSITNIWGNGQLNQEAKEQALQRVIVRYRLQDIKDRLIPVVTDKGLRKFLDDHVFNPQKQKISKDRLIEDLFKQPLEMISKEEKKFVAKQMQTDTVISFQAVKGVPYGLWGLCAGVCIATDVKLWKDPNFYLLAMIDETSRQVVGFLHMYKTEISGKKVLTVPGIEPTVEFLESVDPEMFYPMIEQVLQQIAQKVSYEAVYLPTNNNILSNRSGVVKIVKKQGYQKRVLDHQISWNHLPQPYPFNEVYELPLAVGANIPVLSGLMGRWNYENAEFNSQENKLTLYQATRIPTKAGVVEEEFLSNGENVPRTITLQTRILTEQEEKRVSRLKAELGHETVEYRVLLKNEESVKHRIYGFAVNDIAFIREDIFSEGNNEQVKEALDHEARELTDKEHDVIRQEQYQGGLRELITQLSDWDKVKNSHEHKDKAMLTSLNHNINKVKAIIEQRASNRGIKLDPNLLNQRLKDIEALKDNFNVTYRTELQHQSIVNEDPNFQTINIEIREIVGKLLKSMGLNLEQFEIVLLNNVREPNAGILAYDNKIFINMSLIEMIINNRGTKDSVAFVLAHELRHIIQWTDELIDGKEVNKDLIKRLQQTHAKEYDSDYFALRMIEVAGFSVRSALRTLQMLPNEGKWRFIGIATHPPVKERIRRIQRALNKDYWRGYFNTEGPFSDKAIEEVKRNEGERKAFFSKLESVQSTEDLLDLLDGAKSLMDLEFIMIQGYGKFAFSHDFPQGIMLRILTKFE